MNVNVKWIASAVVMAAALSACGSMGKNRAEKPAEQPVAPQAQTQPQAAPQPAVPQTVKVDSIDSKKEVAYKCGPKGQDKLSVMYGVKDNQLVVAQVKYKNELTPNLFRVVGVNDQNVFWHDGIAWFSGKATPANVTKVNGSMLTLRLPTQVNGKTELVDRIVTKGCVLDKAATARLNK